MCSQKINSQSTLTTLPISNINWLNDNKKDFLGKKLHLIGEFHNKNGNTEITSNYLCLLNSLQIFPKAIFLEEGESMAFLLNRFLNSGDVFLLKLLAISDDDKIYLTEIREYYLKLSDDNKFRFIGIDVDKYPYLTHYSIRVLLLSHKSSLDSSSYRDFFSDILHSFEMKENPETWSIKDIREDLSEILNIKNGKDSIQLIHLLSSDYSEMRKIMDAYSFEGKRKRLLYLFEREDYKIDREYFMCNNIYNEVISNTDGYYVGQIGMFHVNKKPECINPKKSNSYRLGDILNSNTNYSRLNNLIYSNVIYYDFVKKKHYFFLKHINFQISSRLSSIGKDELFFMPLSDSSNFNNVIIYKTLPN